MGLLWRFMGFSPVVQILAGAAEVTAAILLLFRRTVWWLIVIESVEPV